VVSDSNVCYRTNEREVFLLIILECHSEEDHVDVTLTGALDDDIERGPLASRKSATLAVTSLTSCDNQHASIGEVR
jgi:hypothetical protein